MPESFLAPQCKATCSICGMHAMEKFAQPLSLSPVILCLLRRCSMRGGNILGSWVVRSNT